MFGESFQEPLHAVDHVRLIVTSNQHIIDIDGHKMCKSAVTCCMTR